ncbi:MAG: ABC transporter permease, partial [Lewinella sp.]|nr:ABC transporter permease [Lewinella sp.]
MLYNYIKIAWRGLAKHRTYSLINISGLAVGMAVTLLIGLWIHYEFSYDRFLPDFDRIYQVKRHYTTDQIHTDNAISLPLVDIFKQQLPGVQYAAEADWGGTDHSLLVGDTRLYLNGTFTGPDFLNIFQLPMLQGDHQTALLRPDAIVLTASTAKALFGEDDPMNRSIRFDQVHEMTVTGVLNDLPANATLQFNYLVPFSFLEQTQVYAKHARTDWGSNAFRLFVRLAPEVNDEQVAAQIKHLLTENNEKARATKQELSLQAFKDRHLYDKYENGKAVGGYIDYIYMFGLIGILVLLIACINFMNLTTARSLKKAKEVGVRKAIGSKRKQLIFQFLSESLVYTGLSFTLALLLTYLSLWPFNRLMGVEVLIPFEKPSFWLIMLAYLVLTAMLAGG